jgi:uncharacterized protein GlcG (DUF336 family)
MTARDASFELVASKGNITTITLDAPKKIIAVAEKKAFEINQAIDIAVIEVSGTLVSLKSKDGAWIGSIDMSNRKALTSRAYNVYTGELANQLQPNDRFFDLHPSNYCNVMIFPGGISLKQKDQVASAIGVSCGKKEYDQADSETGTATF